MNTAIMFAGGGGSAEGAKQAGCIIRWAANHKQAAVDVHAANHPEALHACEDLQKTKWGNVPSFDLLLASWCCQGNSQARGKAANNPEHDDSRATAWAVLDALEYHRPQFFIGENVKGFLQWALYPAWLMAVEALGYCMDIQVVDAADHGVPQNRQRLLFIGTRGKHPLMLRMPKREHVSARTFIDFDAGNWQPIDKPGRAPATLARVAAGRKLFGDRFLAPYYGTGSGQTGRSLDRPIGTITTRDRWSVIDGDRMRMLMVPEARTGMGFPKTYFLPDDPRLAMHLLGNAVPPPMMCDAITAMLAAA